MGGFWGCLAEAITQNASLQRLYIRQCNIGNDDMKKIAGALVHNATLADIHMDDRPPSEVEAAFVQALQHNGTITSLWIMPGDEIKELLARNKAISERRVKAARTS